MSIYTVTSSKGLIGCNYENRSYIVGFNNIRTARRIARVAQFPPKLELKRSQVIDVTSEVRDEMAKIGLPYNFTSITIDVDSLLFIHKNTDVIDDYFYNVEQAHQADFLMLSFEKNIGLLMPYDLHDENDEYLVYKTNVVDPSSDIDRFRNSLLDM